LKLEIVKQEVSSIGKRKLEGDWTLGPIQPFVSITGSDLMAIIDPEFHARIVAKIGHDQYFYRYTLGGGSEIVVGDPLFGDEEDDEVYPIHNGQVGD